MDIFQIVAIAIIGTLLAITVKPYKNEFAILISIATCALILVEITFGITELFSGFHSIMSSSLIDMRYFEVVIKIIGIAYVTQFASEICKDAGQNSIAIKVEFAGKVMVMVFTLPILSDFLTVVISVLT